MPQPLCATLGIVFSFPTSRSATDGSAEPHSEDDEQEGRNTTPRSLPFPKFLLSVSGDRPAKSINTRIYTHGRRRNLKQALPQPRRVVVVHQKLQLPAGWFESCSFLRSRIAFSTAPASFSPSSPCRRSAITRRQSRLLVFRVWSSTIFGTQPRGPDRSGAVLW